METEREQRRKSKGEIAKCPCCNLLRDDLEDHLFECFFQYLQKEEFQHLTPPSYPSSSCTYSLTPPSPQLFVPKLKRTKTSNKLHQSVSLYELEHSERELVGEEPKVRLSDLPKMLRLINSSFLSAPQLSHLEVAEEMEGKFALHVKPLPARPLFALSPHEINPLNPYEEKEQQKKRIMQRSKKQQLFTRPHARTDPSSSLTPPLSKEIANLGLFEKIKEKMKDRRQTIELTHDISSNKRSSLSATKRKEKQRPFNLPLESLDLHR